MGLTDEMIQNPLMRGQRTQSPGEAVFFIQRPSDLPIVVPQVGSFTCLCAQEASGMFPRKPAAHQGVADAFSGERVHQRGGITDQQTIRPGKNRAASAERESGSSREACSTGVDETSTEIGNRFQERRQQFSEMDVAVAAVSKGLPDTDIGDPTIEGDHPQVTGEQRSDVVEFYPPRLHPLHSLIVGPDTHPGGPLEGTGRRQATSQT